MKYNTKKASEQDIEKILSDWTPGLSEAQGFALESEISIQGRPLYIATDNETARIQAIFDILPTGTHNKNLKVFFSPDFASQEGLTPEEVDELVSLLIEIFLDMMARSELNYVRALRINSSDRLILTTFRGFAEYLAQNGHCTVKSYRDWIEVEKLNLFSSSDD